MLDWNTANFNKAMNKGATDLSKIVTGGKKKYAIHIGYIYITISVLLIFIYS